MINKGMTIYMGGGMIPGYYIINLDIINHLKLYKLNLIMNRLFPFYVLAILLLSGCSSPESSNKLKFSISYSEGLNETALNGRLLLMISNNDEREPRFQIRDDGKTQLIYGSASSTAVSAGGIASSILSICV